MADNLVVSAGVATYTAAADEATYSGDSTKLQLIKIVKVTGPEGSKTVGSNNYHAVAAATTNAANISANPTDLQSIVIFNNTGYPVFVKLHNTSGTPTAGAGVARTFGVEAGRSFALVFFGGLPFSTGLGITMVKGLADSDATALVLNDCVVDIEWTRAS